MRLHGRRRPSRLPGLLAGERRVKKGVGVAEFPSGTVTFFFTDIEGSTRLWQEHPEAMKAALARHDEIVRDAIEGRGGSVVKTTGDGFHAAFAAAHDAIDAAVAGQLALAREPWDVTGPLRVRMGIHTGPAELRDGDYYGTAVNRAARLMSVAHGGQIVMSGAVEQLSRDSLPAVVTLADLGEHRLRDLGQPEHVFQVLHPELPAEFPALRSVETYPSNLPQQLTTFVGRDQELVEIAEVLDEARVVTLIGVGGVGKTRLALQVAAELLPRFGAGAWLCELGPLSDASGVADLVAVTLSVQPRPGETVTESIVGVLRDRQLLLVLDNCEHLVAPAARLVDAIVRACPGVRVLATSREGLGVAGERLMVVRSLAVPEDDAGVDGLVECDAVRLFVDRAADARHGFGVTGENVSAIAQICRRLDGIPLAIELAAARTRMMSPPDIARRLDERFRFLTGGNRTAVERHQTLRAAVDWSYALLDPDEQVLLDRLGVFAGGFTLDAAEAVAGDIESGGDVLDRLGQLVDKSLVVAEEDRGGASGYRLLETIRQYALEHLDATGVSDVVRRRHAEHYLTVARDAEAGLWTSTEGESLRTVDREMANLRAAFDWAVGAGDADIAFGSGRRARRFRYPPAPVHDRPMARARRRHAHRARPSSPSPRRGMGRARRVHDLGFARRVRGPGPAHGRRARGSRDRPAPGRAPGSREPRVGERTSRRSPRPLHHRGRSGPRGRRPEMGDALERPARNMARQPGLDGGRDRAGRAVMRPRSRVRIPLAARRERARSRAQRRGSRAGDPPPRDGMGTRA